MSFPLFDEAPCGCSWQYGIQQRMCDDCFEAWRMKFAILLDNRSCDWQDWHVDWLKKHWR
jgi:hypothetical protein